MTEAFAKQIETEARQAMTELVAAAKLKNGDVLVAVSYTHLDVYKRQAHVRQLCGHGRGCLCGV